MKYKNKEGQWKTLLVEPSGDTLPIGSIVEFNGTQEEIPYGYEYAGESSSTIDVSTDINAAGNNAVPTAKTVKDYTDTSINNLKTEKVLWSGDELPSGKMYSLTDNIFNYRTICIVGSRGNKFYIPIIKNNNFLWGGTNYISGTEQMVTVGLNADIKNDGNSIRVWYFKELVHNPSSNHDAYQEPNLLQIIGIK